MKRVRTLVVEDSPTQRQLLVSILGADPEIEVVGVAGDGREAVSETLRLRPDVVTMDVQMPNVGGIQATMQIMLEQPTAIAIVSDLNPRHIQEAMLSLGVGAVIVLRKPPSPAVPGFLEAAEDLVRTVKQLAAARPARPRPAPPALDGPVRPPAHAVVGVAASTGGPAVIYRMLQVLPAAFTLPIVLVQHISSGFVQGFAEWLGGAGARRVKVAEDGEPLAASTVFVAPEGAHLTVEHRSCLRLDAQPPVGGFRPSATILFESLARVFGPGAVGVILTGMGRDGVRGLEALKRAGGHVLAQDEASSVIFGMPEAAIAAGVVDAVRDIDGLALELVRCV